MIEVILIVHQGRYFSPGKLLTHKHIIDAEEQPKKFDRVTTLCGTSRLVSHLPVSRIALPLCQKCEQIASRK